MINIITQYNTQETIREFTNYLDVIKGKSHKTIKAYESDLTMLFRFLKIYKSKQPLNCEIKQIDITDIDNNFIKTISLSDLYAFISFTEKQRNNGTYSRARKVATIKSYFNYINNKTNILNENPASELESPKINKRHPVYLTLDESKNLLTSLDKTDKNYKRDYCIITLFLNCGMRVSELCNINISKIKGDILTIIGKGNKERTVYLNKASINAINEYLQDRKKIDDISSVDDVDALFISNKKSRISVRTVERLVKKHAENSGLQGNKYTPHKLRHTSATLMYKYGKVDIRSLQQILGHESIATTQIYTHVDSDTLRNAVKLNPLSEEN